MFPPKQASSKQCCYTFTGVKIKDQVRGNSLCRLKQVKELSATCEILTVRPLTPVSSPEQIIQRNSLRIILTVTQYRRIVSRHC